MLYFNVPNFQSPEFVDMNITKVIQKKKENNDKEGKNHLRKIFKYWNYRQLSESAIEYCQSRASLLSISETKTNEVLLACFHGSVEQKVVKKQIVAHNF